MEFKLPIIHLGTFSKLLGDFDLDGHSSQIFFTEDFESSKRTDEKKWNT